MLDDIDNLKSDVLEKKKKIFHKTVEEHRQELGVSFPITVSITEKPCPQSSGNELAHIHVEKGVICVWERKLAKMNFDKIREVAAHEVAHLVSKKHDSKHADVETNLKIKNWRPPSGVIWNRPREREVELKGKGDSLSEKLGEFTVRQLRELAKDKNLSGYSNLKKSELIEFIIESLERTVLEEKISEYSCSYHLCEKRDADLEECKYCGKTFCPNHLEPKKPSLKPWSDSEVEDRIRDSGGHPCPEFSAQKKREEEEEAREIRRAIDGILGISDEIEVFSGGAEEGEEAVTGHDVATRIINRYLSRIKGELSIEEGGDGVSETVHTGGLMKFEGKKSNYSYPSVVKSLEDWRDFVIDRYSDEEFGEEITRIVLEKFASEVYWELVRRNMRINDIDRNACLNVFNKLVSEIEERTKNEGFFREALRETGDFQILNITVKPWISLSGIPNALVRVRDEFGMFSKEGKTDSDGNFQTKVLEGNVEIYVETEEDKEIEYLMVDDEKELTIHPSIF